MISSDGPPPQVAQTCGGGRMTDRCKNCGDEFDFDDPARQFHGDRRYCEHCDIAQARRYAL
jgi:hypothetical protein